MNQTPGAFPSKVHLLLIFRSSSGASIQRSTTPVLRWVLSIRVCNKDDIRFCNLAINLSAEFILRWTRLLISEPIHDFSPLCLLPTLTSLTLATHVPLILDETFLIHRNWHVISCVLAGLPCLPTNHTWAHLLGFMMRASHLPQTSQDCYSS